MSIELFVERELKERKEQGLLRSLRYLDSYQDRLVTIDGRQLINFCSNNYLGLANDARLKQASAEALERFGTGTGASRLICGSFSLHKKLEEAIANFKHTQGALVFNCGYMANLGIIASLMSKGGIIFSDRLNHASIVDALILSRAKFVRFNHTDVEHLEELLKANKDIEPKLIVTDTVFSMDGDLAPLKDIVRLAKKYSAAIMVDEAHATGVFGPQAAGLAQELGLSSQIDIQMGTLSKALGSFGAFVCAKKKIIDYLINTSRSFIYTTSLPAAVIAASLRAIEIIQREPQLRIRLWDNIRFMQQGLGSLGFNCLNSNSAIIPILTRDNKLTMEFSRELFKRGIFIQGIRPPTVGKNQARLRLTVIATHTRQDLENCLQAVGIIARKLGII
jgi:glycine C-acetyltransferase